MAPFNQEGLNQARRRQAFLERLLDQLLEDRIDQHRRHKDLAVRFDFNFIGGRVGQFTLRFSRLADVLIRHYKIDRVEAAFRVVLPLEEGLRRDAARARPAS